jgi:hypothetical protein
VTSLEKAILAQVICARELLALPEAEAALGLMTGELEEALWRVRQGKDVRTASWLSEFGLSAVDADPYLFLENLRKWCEYQSVVYKQTAEAIESAVHGSAHDVVERMRRSRTLSRRRTGAGEQ